MKLFNKILKTSFLFFISLSILFVVGCENSEAGGQTYLDAPTEVRTTQTAETTYFLFFKGVKETDTYNIRIINTETKEEIQHECTYHDGELGYKLQLSLGSYKIYVESISEDIAVGNSPLSTTYYLVVDGVYVPEPTPQPEESYTITYVLNGGINAKDAPISYKKGETVILPTPTKEGFTFEGWYDQVNFSGQKLEVISNKTTGNITLYAKWKEVGGSNPNPNPDLTGYYKDANGKEGNELLLALRTIISKTKHTETYSELSYDLAWTDQDPNNSKNVITFYCGTSVKGAWDSGHTWNKEHVWPKSLGGFGTSGAGADAHHIRPSIPSVNTDRGNKLYADLNGHGSPIIYGGKTVAWTSGNNFEPLDSVKGDAARIVLYLLTRYNLSSRTFPATSIRLLVEWNALDPVSEFEKVRNERVYGIQGNRNPFIDHPELVDLIW